MSLTFFGWFLVVSSIPLLLIFLLRPRGLRNEQLDWEACKAGLEDIEARHKQGELNEAEAGAARLLLLSRLPSSRWGFSQNIQGPPGKLFVAAAIFLLLSGIGSAVSYVGRVPEVKRTEETIAFSEPDGEMLAHLTDYARSIGTEQPSSMAATGELLPDVTAMTERLAARLETTPQDIEGWRMLGWSYFHTEHYEQAATAFGRALELDPGSAELKLSYEEAKAKSTQSGNLEIASSSQTEAVDKSVAIRSMVEGLAQRLENSPRDVEGWIHLMRSRVVLGEGEVAATAFREALEVFVEDPAASNKIRAAALELGLKAE